jgi:CelD/BcsL family acetyltransferase involved in cellulose biosynthesis
MRLSRKDSSYMSLTCIASPPVALERPAPLTVAWITREEEFGALEPEWRLLAERCPSATVFQGWEWNAAWWRSFGGGRKLRLIAAWERERLMGLAPLVGRSLGPLRLLEFLGAGRTDYPGFLVERVGEWDLLWLRDMPLDAAGRGRLETAVGEAGLRGEPRPWDVAPYLHTSGGWAGYLAARSANFRSDLKRKRKRLEQAGPVGRRWAAPGRWNSGCSVRAGRRWRST